MTVKDPKSVAKCPRCGKSCIHCLKLEADRHLKSFLELEEEELGEEHPDHHECWSHHRWKE